MVQVPLYLLSTPSSPPPSEEGPCLDVIKADTYVVPTECLNGTANQENETTEPAVRLAVWRGGLWAAVGTRRQGGGS